MGKAELETGSEGSGRAGALAGEEQIRELFAQNGRTVSEVKLVTDRAVLGKTVGELNLDDRFSVAVTRVTRADLEMARHLDLLRLDVVMFVNQETNQPSVVFRQQDGNIGFTEPAAR